MWKIAKDTQVLDLNSSYAYALIATHFHHTSAIAMCENKPIGFTSAYMLPNKVSGHSELFIWQVGVDPQFQGQGIAFEMILHILNREVCKNVTTLKTTISPSNNASSRLFQKIASHFRAGMARTPYFGKDHFPDSHEQEDLITISPLSIKQNQEEE